MITHYNNVQKERTNFGSLFLVRREENGILASIDKKKTS